MRLAPLLLALLPGSPEPLAFRLEGLDGRIVESARFRGKPVLLALVASWSPPSRALAPRLRILHARFARRGVLFAAVCYEAGGGPQRVEAARAFAEAQRWSLPVLLGDDALRARVPGFRGYPTLVFLDAGHRVVEVRTGYDGTPKSDLEIERRLDSLVPPSPERAARAPTAPG